jgi:AbrB family looped-hinge helix DNA binding protein
MQIKVREKGQLTLPKEIRDEIGVEPGESLSVLVINGEIRMRPVKGVVERTFGKFRHLAEINKGKTFEEILAAEKEAAARGWVEGYLLEENRE